MISTLFKHEFKRTRKWLGAGLFVVVLSVTLCVLGAVLLPAPLGLIMGVLGFVLATVLPMAVQLMLGVDFYRSGYSRTGYFTMTLPIRGATVFWAKFTYGALVALLTALLSYVLALLTVLSLVLASGTSTEEIGSGFGKFLDAVGEMPAWVVLVLVALLLVFPVVGLVQYYFAVTVGNESVFGRLGVGGPVIMWLLYYAVSQVGALIGMLLPLTWRFQDGEVVYQSGLADFLDTDGSVLPLGIFVVAFVIAGVALWRAKVSFDRKVELR